MTMFRFRGELTPSDLEVARGWLRRAGFRHEAPTQKALESFAGRTLSDLEGKRLRQAISNGRRGKHKTQVRLSERAEQIVMDKRRRGESLAAAVERLICD